MRLTIAIPTITTRKVQFDKLNTFLLSQRDVNHLTDKVEIISLCDNKEISIGAKRQKLYEMAKGEFTVMIDDDDWVASDFIRNIVETIEANPNIDAIGYIEHCDMGNTSCLSFHSDKYSEWSNGKPFERTLFFKDPIRTSICLSIGVADLRFGEDHDFARRLKKSNMLKSTVDIPIIMYKYRYKKEPHKQKYGIK